jgi:hypothetical protein
VPLDRNAKVRVMMVARALMRHQEKGKAYGKISAKTNAGGAHRAALALAQRRDRQVLPRHTRRIAEAAGCARSTVYEAIRALEQVGVLSWVNRLKRDSEYVPGLFGNPMQRRCAEPGRRPRFEVAGPLARLAGKAASAVTGRSNRENRGTCNPMQQRCADRLFSQSDPLRQL